MAQLFYNKKMNKFFYVLIDSSEYIKCSVCNNIIQLYDYAFLQRSWSKHNFKQHLFCRKCVKENKKRVYDEFAFIQVTEDYPEGSFAVLNYVPQMKACTSVFDAALSNKNIDSNCSSCSIIDNTVFAGRESFDGAVIGRDVSDDLEKLDAPLKGDEGIAFLDILKDSKPVIEHDEKKLLRCDK